MISLVLDILLKGIDVFLVRSKWKSAMQKTLFGFIEKYDKGVVQNALIKRRYDECLYELRKDLKQEMQEELAKQKIKNIEEKKDATNTI